MKVRDSRTQRGAPQTPKAPGQDQTKIAKPTRDRNKASTSANYRHRLRAMSDLRQLTLGANQPAEYLNPNFTTALHAVVVSMENIPSVGARFNIPDRTLKQLLHLLDGDSLAPLVSRLHELSVQPAGSQVYDKRYRAITELQTLTASVKNLDERLDAKLTRAMRAVVMYMEDINSVSERLNIPKQTIEELLTLLDGASLHPLVARLRELTQQSLATRDLIVAPILASQSEADPETNANVSSLRATTPGDPVSLSPKLAMFQTLLRGRSPVGTAQASFSPKRQLLTHAIFYSSIRPEMLQDIAAKFKVLPEALQNGVSLLQEFSPQSTLRVLVSWTDYKAYLSEPNIKQEHAQEILS